MRPRSTDSTRTRRAAALVVAFVAVVSAAPPASGARSASCPRESEKNRYGTWTAIPAPEMPRASLDPDGAGGIVRSNRNVVHAYAADPLDPGTIYVADELTIMRSTDGGCSWEKSFSVLDGGDLSAQTDSIVSLHAVAVSARETRVYALVTHGHRWCCSDDLSASVPRVAVLDESGEWTVREPTLEGPGTPLVGEAGRLWVAAGTAHMYLRVNDGTQSGPALYASDDDGRTWELRGARDFVTHTHGGPAHTCAAAATCTALDYRVLAPDPLDHEVLWSANRTGILKSEDGGRSWRHVLTLDWSARLVDVYHRRGKPARIAVFGEDHNGTWSSDGGETWRRATLYDGGGGVASAASGRSANEVVHVDPRGRPQITNGVSARDVSLDSHGRSLQETQKSTLLRDVTYVPATRSYFFLGGDGREGRTWFGKSVVTFRPRPLQRTLSP